MMNFVNKLINLFDLCVKMRTMGTLLVCVLYVTGCTESDRAVTFNDVKVLDQNSQGTGATPEGEDRQRDLSVDKMLSDEKMLSDDNMISTDIREICVYVCGEVNYPGVYSLPEGSRANDALSAAGGFTDEADKSYVNLAAKVDDGDKLYFPGIYEAEQERAAEKALEAGLVDINTADEALLCTLPGIGNSRAKAIITYRENNGPFEKKEDIMKVSGIKDSAYQKICDKITAGNE